ncbi:MAG: Na+:solute symporter, partial [Thermoguttaceae bacterium]|nr:Na+:solute symporter [Thermoguttaceae bacterium]
MIVPFVVLWWSAWYPGSEPGGGSYTAQRMLAAKNESHAVGATLFFNVCHYAARPWPWFIVALASLVAYPTLDSLREAFPNVAQATIGHDMAYPAMLRRLPVGLSGLALGALFAAYVSTISTHLNLGASYVVNDWYRRFVKPDATEKQLVFAGRLWTVILMLLADFVTIYLKSALQVFQVLVLIGGGTGLLFLLRWFWRRINAWSEISAMCFSFVFATYFQFIHDPLWRALAPVVGDDGVAALPAALDFSDSTRLILCVVLTTIGWLVTSYATSPTDDETARNFIRRTGVGGFGWKKVIDKARAEGVELTTENGERSVGYGVLCSVISCVAVYAALFATGFYIYGKYVAAVALTVVFA